LTGSASGIRAFCEDLRAYQPEHFGSTDFKIVDGLRDSQRLKGLKVWHVEELVTYGFERGVALLEDGGTHLPPEEWHAKAAEPGTVLIDVRNANENAIGRFQPLGDASRVLDPNMRTSTEFPAWVDEAMPKLQQAKQVLMYCTGGIRCERASALLVQKGLDASKVFQLEGGIHRYLEAFPQGGHWIGKNYTFDRRFAHGPVDAPPEKQVAVGRCCLCTAPWDRYQAHKKCVLCRMEVLLCRECERGGKFKGQTLKCHLCGGPKPSYLPESDKTLKFKKHKYHSAATGEGDY
jgi:predicted sulfurtransferase